MIYVLIGVKFSKPISRILIRISYYTMAIAKTVLNRRRLSTHTYNIVLTSIILLLWCPPMLWITAGGRYRCYKHLIYILLRVGTIYYNNMRSAPIIRIAPQHIWDTPYSDTLLAIIAVGL